jgi:hypothetical protein
MANLGKVRPSRQPNSPWVAASTATTAGHYADTSAEKCATIFTAAACTSDDAAARPPATGRREPALCAGHHPGAHCAELCERRLIEVDESTDNSGKKLLGQAAILLLVACRLPEVIMETGGWRAWLGSTIGAGLLLFFITDLRDFIRRRRAIRRAHVTQPEQSLPEVASPGQNRLALAPLPENEKPDADRVSAWRVPDSGSDGGR